MKSETEVTPPAHTKLDAMRQRASEHRFVIPAKAPKQTQEEWAEFILNIAGSIPDPSFQRHDQGEYEQRDELE